MHRLVALDGSARRVKFAKALLGFYSSFDRSMVLLQHMIQILHRAVPAAATKRTFFFDPRNGGVLDAGLVGVDHARLGMRWIGESLAE